MKPVLHDTLKFPRRLAELDPPLTAKVNQARQLLLEVDLELSELLPMMRTAIHSGIQDVRKAIITTPITITKGDITDLRGAITLTKRTYAYKNLRVDDSLKLAKSKCAAVAVVLKDVRKLNNDFCKALLDMAKAQVRS